MKPTYTVDPDPRYPDLTIPEVTVAPSPLCKVHGVRMYLQRPYSNNRWYREYWRCMVADCEETLQIDDNGEPINERN